ncbi:hypothetical protein ACLOJK_034710 [Asimina triloba]
MAPNSRLELEMELSESPTLEWCYVELWNIGEMLLDFLLIRHDNISPIALAGLGLAAARRYT